MMIPLPYKILAFVALLLATFAGGYTKGTHAKQTEWDGAKLHQQLADSFAAKAQAEQSVKIVTKYIDRVKVVHDTAGVISKEVKIYVPSDSCSMPGAFRVLHDAAAANELPDATRVANAPAADAQTVTTTVAENYETCHTVREQLTSLQEWIRGIK